MSNVMINNTATPHSARAAALERRRALSQNGSAALGAKKSVSTQMASNSAAKGTVGPIPSVILASTTAQDTRSDDACGCKKKDNTSEVISCERAIDPICALVDDQPEDVVGSVVSAVRNLCKERRRALSSQGKTAIKSSSGSAIPARHKVGKSSVMGELSGRDAARVRREEMCRQGRGADPACRPSGRVRPKKLGAPVKVETGTTLRGIGVTGTQVECNGKVTGVESGICRVITGTEYIGAEQYGTLCAAVPAPASAKVSLGTTSRGQRVSGTEVGRSLKVTGDERGTDKTVTGTEYLSVEQFEKFSEIKPVLAPAKVGIATTRAGQSVSGSEIGRSTKVTGDEQGSCSKLTGSQYVQDQSDSLCRSGNGIPHKVSVMSTLKDRTVTGTDVAPSDLVTGGERGVCAGVTGTEFSGLAQYQGCNREPVPTPEKVGVMRTRHGQQVSGTAVEHSAKVTGDEYGGCQPISGTEYIGPDQYVAFCDAERQAASQALMASRGARAGKALSGTRFESGDKVTGAARGENQVLSGTPYSGSNQRVSQRGANSNPHPLTQGPANEPRKAEPAPQAQRVQGNFSIATPARSAQDSSLNRITGTAYGAIGRITGPINMAAGLVSGTPEFRYQEDSVVDVMGQAPTVEEIHSRLTGDGREGGFAITGAVWRRNENVTGTEGTSMHRNPTFRGEPRGAVAAVIGASQLKDRERVELPASKITGSSGNDAKGSYITYSGGARG